jgi:uncharacterized protein (DUF4415 family)
MKENRKSTVRGWSDKDAAPDLSSAEWRKKFAKAPVKRGRPKSQVTKVSTTIRLDADVVAKFRAKGPLWQSRINAALREWLARKAG